MSPYIKLLFFGLFIFLVIGFYQLYMIAMDSPHRISSADARKRLAEHKVDLVLDVRTKTERNVVGFFPRSIHMPRDRLEADFQRAFPDKSIRVLIYCNTGQRARLATDTLHAMGYTNTKYITGTHLSLMN
jgi:phage shock protein E